MFSLVKKQKPMFLNFLFGNLVVFLLKTETFIF